uniref:Acyl-CoA synthetase short chain family member 2 n=1 Tax=Homo sapiens TaxID=9606 RepID=F8WBQ7_HUMAN
MMVRWALLCGECRILGRHCQGILLEDSMPWPIPSVQL